jgi:hypothetical protein
MKKILLLISFSLALFTNCASCSENSRKAGDPDEANKNQPTPTEYKMKIKIGTSTFTATMYDNATTTAFKSLLPKTVDMIELNGNEKYYDLPGKLPTNASNPRKIQKGDLMLYGSNTLVLFYKSFATSYSYTSLGRINDTTGLDAAVGSGNVTVVFELE